MKKRNRRCLLAIIAMEIILSCSYRAKAAGLLGFTYTQDGVFISKKDGSQIANIFLYGWGSLWPDKDEGEVGEHDSGQSIDKRINAARADGQEIVLSCATAPSNYRRSHHPWNMQERVLPDMEAAFASHCAQAARRWNIKRVQVWNEMKGYWIPSPAQRWDYEGYTRFYNKVYKAVKEVDPQISVGGGYIVLDDIGTTEVHNGISINKQSLDALRYWISNAIGYDAVCLDAHRKAQEFSGIMDYVREMAHGKAIWWSEYYSYTDNEMRAARDVISRNQQPGDLALWWAEKRFEWSAGK